MAKPIAVFDIDGTIFRSSLLIEVTRAMVELGAFPANIEQEFHEEYTNWLNREDSYDAYIKKVVQAFAKHLAGLRPEQLSQAADLTIARTARQTYRYTRDLITQLKPNHVMLAISQSPAELVTRFAKVYGFDLIHATTYDVKNGRYTGSCYGDRTPKDVTLKDLLKQNHLNLDNSLGVGDSDSDAAFLNLVERPIAFNPNSVLFQAAITNHWQVVVERKDVIYYYNQDNPQTPNNNDQ